MANKNSVYVQSLVDFLLDTKPYHSKLTEIVEEYRFSDEMTVHFDERLFTNTMMKAAWMYTYFSGGVPSGQVSSMHQLVAPNEYNGQFIFGTDENTDLPLVPLAYDPKSFDGPGLSNAAIRRVIPGGTIDEPILEGHDIYQSHGAYTFQIFQTISTQPLSVGHFAHAYTVSDAPFPFNVTLPFTNADVLIITGPATQVDLQTISVTGPGQVHVDGISNALPYVPLYTEKRNEGLLAAATGAVQALALDTGNPASAISKIQVLLTAIAAQLISFPNALASTELAAVQLIVTGGLLPSSYEALLNALIAGATPVISGYVDWVGQDVTFPYSDKYVDQTFAQYSTGLYFNEYTDIGQRELGALKYDDVLHRDDIVITAINSNPLRPDYEEWTLTAATPTTFTVRGSVSGTIGSASMPGVFSSPQISFTMAAGVSPMVTGTEILLTPAAKITIHSAAPLEAWSLIKANPRSYSRPILTSTRYGYIQDPLFVRDRVQVLDQTMPTTVIVLEATSSTHFTLTSTSESLYTGSVTVGVDFNDGRLAFRVVAGSAYAFQVGDRFYIELVNKAPEAEDFDLYYGYDTEPYDADSMVYNTVNNLVQDYLTTLDFGWDSRFVNYDLVSFNLQLTQAAVDGRQFRLRALRDISLPLPLQNSVPQNLVNELATDDPTNPNAVAQFDMPNDVTGEGLQSSNDPDNISDISLWYASSFALEYLNGSTWTFIDTVPVGSAYTNATYGVSFTLAPAAKPFIASRVITSGYTTFPPGAPVSETVDGGDTFFWIVKNDPPEQQGPAGLSSPNVTHLWIHGDSYHASTPAKWKLTWSSPLSYVLQGIYTTGPLNGQNVFPNPGVTILTADGRSYSNDTYGLHWTVYDGVAGTTLGDSISIETFERKPSYLVYGTVSGWQPDAEVGQWYWNGKIGFKPEFPVARLFEGNTLLVGSPWATSVGTVTLNSLRFDAPNMTYTLRSHVNGHWTLYRDGKVVADGTTSVTDQYVNLSLPTGVAGTLLVLDVTGERHTLSVGHDLAIVRTDAGRTLHAGEVLLTQRAENDGLIISVKPKDPAHALVLQALAPVTIDLRFVDHNALSGTPLSNTSPETAVLQGWIPLLQYRRDSVTSEAIFSDSQTSVVVHAAATGQQIGTVTSLSANPREPVVFQWDPTFASTYLPLNVEATIVTLGSGLDEMVHVNMREGIMFLLSGGGLDNSSLFIDTVNVAFAEDNQWQILANYNTDFSAAVADTGFTGFLPGYDNTLFDEEDGANGFYDAGQPLASYFLRAQVLSNLDAHDPHPVLTTAEQTELDALLGEIDPYLNGTLAATTLDFFIAALNADNAVNYTPVLTGFGVPNVGMGMEIQQTNVNTAGAGVVESVTVVSTDNGYPFNLNGFGLGEMDQEADTTAIMMVNAFPTSARAASTTNRALTGLASVDGVVLVDGDLVLLKNQTVDSENGLYAAHAGSWTRAVGFTTAASYELNTEIQVLEGSANRGTVWVVSSVPTTIDVDPITFSAVLVYAAFDTPLFTADPGGRVIDISLTFSYAGTPKVYVWLPSWTSPVSALVEQVSARVFRLSLPARSEFKLIAG